MAIHEHDPIDIDNLPRCYYCKRLAPEFQFKGMYVCEHCMSAPPAPQEWVMYLLPSGMIAMTPADNPDDVSDCTELARGSFRDVWAQMPKSDTD